MYCRKIMAALMYPPIVCIIIIIVKMHIFSETVVVLRCLAAFLLSPASPSLSVSVGAVWCVVPALQEHSRHPLHLLHFLHPPASSCQGDGAKIHRQMLQTALQNWQCSHLLRFFLFG